MSSGLAKKAGVLWVVGKARKPHVCRLTGVPIAKGEMAFRPISNGYDRMDRIHPDAMKPFLIGD